MQWGSNTCNAITINVYHSSTNENKNKRKRRQHQTLVCDDDDDEDDKKITTTIQFYEGTIANAPMKTFGIACNYIIFVYCDFVKIFSLGL